MIWSYIFKRRTLRSVVKMFVISIRHLKFFLILFLLKQIFDNYLVASEKLELEGKIIRTKGDIILGGIFPMHEHSLNGRPEYPCGAVKEEKGIQRLEAMLYAIDSINQDEELLPNITLGALIIDSCSSDTYALEQSMEFVRYYMNQDMSEYKCEDGKPPAFIPHKPVTGVIGASFSVVSIMVANILRLFKIPQISYASTSTELSDKNRFEYFTRVVPPDNFQAQAMAEIVHALNWLYVSTVAVEGDYGEKGIASFIQISGTLGICIAISEKVSRNSKSEDFDRIIENLLSKPNARAVIMFVDEDNVRKLLQAAIRANKSQHFYWIASDSWGAKSHPVRDQEFAAVNAITVLPHRTSLPGFDNYYRSLRPKTEHLTCKNGSNRQHPENSKLIINCRNIWFNEFWSQHNKCSFEKDANKPCTGKETITDYEQEGLVPFVVDAVYAMAHAIHNYYTEMCDGIPFIKCEHIQPAPFGVKLLKYIHNVQFSGRQGTTVRFNKDGDAYGFYNIYQYQQKGEKYDYVQVGTWKQEHKMARCSSKAQDERAGSDYRMNYSNKFGCNTRLEMDKSALKWTGVVPKLVCSEPCPVGHVRNHQDQCCWSCVRCREDAYVIGDKCETCKPGWAPDLNRTGCNKLKPEVISWNSPWALVPICFSLIGIFFTLLTVIIFIIFNRTPVIMASGRELCYVLLSGIFCCYCTTFVILAPPSFVHCTALRIAIGLGLSICYSAIFIKTNRISRIFNCGVKSAKRPIYISPTSQISFSIGLISIQLLGSVVWSFIDTPDVKEIHPYALTAVLTCKVSSHSVALSLLYNIFLICLCTIYAFKTRKIPENFNEAKYIGFTMYSTCIVWLAFLPIYFGTRNDYEIQLSSLCMCLNISATTVLLCLLAPKVFLVLFQPYKNVRPPVGLGTIGTNNPLATRADRRGEVSAVRFVRQSQNRTHNFSHAPPHSLSQSNIQQITSTTASPATPAMSVRIDSRRIASISLHLDEPYTPEYNLSE